MGFQLRDITERLFTDARVIFDDAKITIDTSGVEASQGQMIVQKDAKKAVIPFFKNIMIIGQDTLPFEGVTVYSLPTNRVFLPKQAAELFDEY
jgi:hypothetical protein